MKTNLSAIHCVIENCTNTTLNKSGISFHQLTTNNKMRERWLKILKNKCSMLDWDTSKICSKHFELKYFNSQHKLKENAIPTLFNVNSSKKDVKGLEVRTKVDRLLNKLTQAELTADIKNSMSKLKEPAELDYFVTDDLKCKVDTPIEAQLWLMLKKQQHLNNRLRDLVSQTNKHVEILENSVQLAKDAKKEKDQTIEYLRYIVKCLQEKHATLEEQIEVFTAVESR